MRALVPFAAALLVAMVAPAAQGLLNAPLGQAGFADDAAHVLPGAGGTGDALDAVKEDDAAELLADGGAVVDLPGATVALGWGDHLVGYKAGERDAALLSIRLAGGVVEREDVALGVALVSASDAARFTALVAVSPGVEYVEANDRTRMEGVQWNGAQWNGAQWNGVEWNGAQWNGAEAEGAEWNAHHGAPDEADDPGRSKQWGLADVRAPAAWGKTMGERRADLCVLDSGVALDHKDLAAARAEGYNAIEPGKGAHDDAGHGTHVAGIAAATVGNGWGTAGVGNVRVMPVKVLGADGTGTEADLAFGLRWCADRDAEVALMALGVDDAGPTLDRALAYAAKKDVLLVASAGNAGACRDCVGYPARDPRVVAVSATDPAHRLAPFSSQGAQVELAAPGVDVLSTLPDDRFAYGSGTSQAAALAAGAAALVRDAHPELSASETRERLQSSARDMGSPRSFGHGALDVGAAVEG